MYDLHTQVVLFVNANYDRRSIVYTTKQLAKIYGINYNKMYRLLHNLVENNRLIRITMAGQPYLYGPYRCIQPPEPEIVEEAVDLGLAEPVGLLRRLWNWLITPLGGEKT